VLAAGFVALVLVCARYSGLLSVDVGTGRVEPPGPAFFGRLDGKYR
jgi:hypothetical protein